MDICIDIFSLLIVILLCIRFPPFPEVIAFGNDLKKRGIACHHPKLLVLQREDSIRVVITSANLVAKQVIFFLCLVICFSTMFLLLLNNKWLISCRHKF